MDDERSDNDVLEIELPAYQEDSFAIPDVEAESSFAENKEEVYRRNRLMAADMQMEVLAAKEEAKAVKKAEFEDLYKESAAAVNYGRSMKIIFSVLAVMLAAVIAVLAILFIQMRSSLKNVSMSAEAEEIVSSVTAPVVTEVPKKAAVSEKEEFTYLTMDTSPLSEEEGTLVYNAEKISYRFAPYYGVNEDYKTVLYVDITAKKIVDDIYLRVIPEFSLADSSSGSEKRGFLSEYEKGLAIYPSGEFYRVGKDGKMEQYEPDPEAFGFDRYDLCTFTMCFDVPEYDDSKYDLIRYCPENGPEKYIQNTDSEFAVSMDVLSGLSGERSKAAEEAKAAASDMKTTVVREPFEDDGSALIYNSDIMSYKIKPFYISDKDGNPIMRMEITIKNLTDYDYYIIPMNFNLELSSHGKNVVLGYYSGTVGADGTAPMQIYDVEEFTDGEWVASSGKGVAYGFGPDSFCKLTLNYKHNEGDILEAFTYDPLFRTNQEYYQKTDEGFTIPFEELEKYIKYSPLMTGQ